MSCNFKDLDKIYVERKPEKQSDLSFLPIVNCGQKDKTSFGMGDENLFCTS